MNGVASLVLFVFLERPSLSLSLSLSPSFPIHFGCFLFFSSFSLGRKRRPLTWLSECQRGADALVRVIDCAAMRWNGDPRRLDDHLPPCSFH